jgi:hypothetical protein
MSDLEYQGRWGKRECLQPFADMTETDKINAKLDEIEDAFLSDHYERYGSHHNALSLIAALRIAMEQINALHAPWAEETKHDIAKALEGKDYAAPSKGRQRANRANAGGELGNAPAEGKP